MIIRSIAFLIAALFMASLDLGGGAGIATRLAELCFAISVALLLLSLIARRRRSDRRVAGTKARQ